MGIDFSKGYFDAVTDAHGTIGLSTKIPEMEKPRVLRAYINFRLLFWKEIFFSDAIINNNKNLRVLMFPDDGSKYAVNNPFLPQDYHRLLEHGAFKIAMRDESFDKANPAALLFERQKDSRHIDLPTPAYVGRIDEIIQNGREKGIAVPFSLNEVSRLFNAKMKEYLLAELPGEDKELVNTKKSLYNAISEQDTVNFKDVLDILEKKLKKPKKSRIYKKIKADISHYYNNNVPEIMKLNYETTVKNLRPQVKFGENKISTDAVSTSNHILFSRAFDIDVLSYVDSTTLIQALKQSQRHKFIKKLSDTVEGRNNDIDALSAALESYARQLDRLFKDSFSKKMESELRLTPTSQEKSIVVTVYENFWVKSIELSLGTGLGFVPVIGNIAGSAFSILSFLFDQLIVPRLDTTVKEADYHTKNAKHYLNLKEKSIIVRE